MRSTSRITLQLSVVGSPVRGQLRLTSSELAAAVGVSEATLARLVRSGLVEPVSADANEFTADTAVRLKRMLRLHDDLDVDLAGAAIIVDLLERMERLERDLERLRGGHKPEGEG